MKIHFGVLEHQYENGQPLPEVAQILEEKYGLFSAFVRRNEKFIAQELTYLIEAKAAAITGNPQRKADNIARANAQFNSNVRDRFMTFLDTKEIEKMGIPGVPTQAALKGFSNRFKHNKTKGTRRPSFIDTGLLQTSFRTWIED